MKKVIALLIAALMIACAAIPALALENDDEATEIEIDFNDLFADLEDDAAPNAGNANGGNTTVIIISVAAAVVVAAGAVTAFIIIKKKKA